MWNNILDVENRKRPYFFLRTCDGIFGYLLRRQAEFRRFLTPVRDSDSLSVPDRRQSSCLRRRDLLHRGFRQKRAIYIPRYTCVRFLRLDGISKRRDVSPTAMLQTSKLPGITYGGIARRAVWRLRGSAIRGSDYHQKNVII